MHLCGQSIFSIEVDLRGIAGILQWTSTISLRGQCCPAGILARTGSELIQATDADLNKPQKGLNHFIGDTLRHHPHWVLGGRRLCY